MKISMYMYLGSRSIAASLMAMTLLTVPMIVCRGFAEQPPVNLPLCPECVPDAALGLGSAAKCTVLQLEDAKVSLTGISVINGQVGIAPGGKFSMSGGQLITGPVRLGPGASFDDGGQGTVNVLANEDLSAEIGAAYIAALAAASKPCDQSFGRLDGNIITNLVGVTGLNVIWVKDVVLNGKQIRLTGEPGAQ